MLSGTQRPEMQKDVGLKQSLAREQNLEERVHVADVTVWPTQGVLGSEQSLTAVHPFAWHAPRIHMGVF